MGMTAAVAAAEKGSASSYSGLISRQVLAYLDNLKVPGYRASPWPPSGRPCQNPR